MTSDTDALYSFGANSLGALLSLGVSLALARILGPSGYGEYTFVLALALIGVMLARAGQVPMATRDVARSEASGSSSNNRRIVAATRLASLLASAAVITAGGLGLVIWDGSDIDELTFWAALILIPLLAMESIHAATLRGVGNVVAAQVTVQVVRPLLLLIALSCGLVVVDALTASLSMALHVVAALGSVVFAASRLNAREERLGHTLLSLDLKGAKNRLRRGREFLGIETLDAFGRQMDVVVIGILLSTSDVGVYRVAIPLAGVLGYALAASNAALQPVIARHASIGRVDRIQAEVSRHRRRVLQISLPILAVIVVMGAQALESLYGPEYTQAYLPLLVLSLARLVDVFFGPVVTILNMTGHQRETIKGLAFATPVALVVMVGGVATLGIVGAAVGRFSYFLVWNGLLSYRTSRRLGISTISWN